MTTRNAYSNATTDLVTPFRSKHAEPGAEWMVRWGGTLHRVIVLGRGWRAEDDYSGDALHDPIRRTYRWHEYGGDGFAVAASHRGGWTPAVVSAGCLVEPASVHDARQAKIAEHDARAHSRAQHCADLLRERYAGCTAESAFSAGYVDVGPRDATQLAEILLALAPAGVELAAVRSRGALWLKATPEVIRALDTQTKLA